MPGNVPQAVVKLAGPAGLLVDPARALVEHLVEPLAGKGALADGVVAEQFDLGRGEGPRVAAADQAFVGLDLYKGLAQGAVGGAAAVRVLDAMQVGDLYQAVRAGLGVGLFQDKEFDVGDFHIWCPSLEPDA